MAPPPSTLMLWGGLALLNVALAVLLWRDGTPKLGARVVAVWAALNGLGVPLLSSGLVVPDPVDSDGERALFNASVLLQSATAGIILLLPFLLPKPLADRRWMIVFAGLALAHGALRFAIEADRVVLETVGDDLPPGTPRPNVAPEPWEHVVVSFDRLLLPFATLISLLRYQLATTTEERRSVGFVLAALALTSAAFTAYYLRVDDLATPVWGFDLASPLDVAAGLLAGVCVVGVIVAARLREGAMPPAGAAVIGAVAIGSLFLVLPTLDVTLSYILFRPLLLTYALMYGAIATLDLRRHLGLLSVLVLGATVPLFIAVFNAAVAQWNDGIAALALALLAAVAALAFLARALAPGVLSSAGATERAREAYRAALAESIRSGQPAHVREPVLAALRRSLRISEREHALLESGVRDAHEQGPRAIEVGAIVLGKYRVLEPLGEGATSRVWKARDERLQRDVVLKSTHHEGETQAQRALQEARALARVSHAHVVALHDAELVGNDVILVLEHVGGGTLAERLADGRLGSGDAVRIVDEVLQALEAAHARGVLHKDVKPENVLLTPEGRAKLGDFGIAQDVDLDATATSMTLTSPRAGSVQSMAPEQVRGGRLDARTDLYAVGALLYRALSGRSYLDLRGRTLVDAQTAILDEEPLLPLEDVPYAMNDLLASALAKDPGERPQSAAEFRRKLASIVTVG